MSYINAYTVDTHLAFMGMPFVRSCVYRAFMRMYMICSGSQGEYQETTPEFIG